MTWLRFGVLYFKIFLPTSHYLNIVTFICECKKRGRGSFNKLKNDKILLLNIVGLSNSILSQSRYSYSLSNLGVCWLKSVFLDTKSIRQTTLSIQTYSHKFLFFSISDVCISCHNSSLNCQSLTYNNLTIDNKVQI